MIKFYFVFWYIILFVLIALKVEGQKVQLLNIDSVVNQYRILESESKFSRIQPIGFIDFLQDTSIGQGSLRWVNPNNRFPETGLEWNASYIENFNAIVIQDADFLYERKFQTGLTFNVLQNGLVAAYFKRKFDEANEKYKRVWAKDPSLSMRITGLRRKWMYVFNKSRLYWLRKLAAIQTVYLQTLQQGLNSNFITEYEWLNENLNAQSTQMQLAFQEAVHSHMSKEFAGDTQVIYQPFWVPELNPEILVYLDFIDSVRRETSYNAYKVSQMASSNIVSKIGLNMRFQYNLYDFGANQDVRLRDVASLSINSSVPFSAFYPDDRKELFQREMYEKLQRIDEQKSRNNLLFKEYFKHLKNYIEIQHSILLLKEKIRVQEVKRELGDETYVAMTDIEQYRKYFETKILSIEALELVYDDILQFMIQYPEVKVEKYISNYKMPPSSLLTDFDEIYVWSSVFLDYSMKSVIDYASQSGVKEFIILHSIDYRKRELCNAFAEAMIHGNGKVQWMFANDNYILDPNYSNKLYASLSLKQPSEISVVHLDIEPHTLPDYAERKAEYLIRLVDIYKEVKNVCNKNGWRLNVSVPLSYPIATYEEIYETVDGVYLMAYEHVDANYLYRKIQPIRDLGQNKTKICLRTADFESISDLREFAKVVKVKLGVNSLVLHDLKGLIQLQNK